MPSLPRRDSWEADAWGTETSMFFPEVPQISTPESSSFYESLGLFVYTTGYLSSPSSTSTQSHSLRRNSSSSTHQPQNH